MSRVLVAVSGLLAIALVVIAATTPATSQTPQSTPKSGGVLNAMQREDLPQGFSIHETATISSVFPAAPCVNNLVIYDPMKRVESMDTVIGELAEKWSWQDNYRNLVFFLRTCV